MAYPDSVKAEALAVLESNAGNKLRTSQELEIARSTLRHWASGDGVNDDVAAIGQRKREELKIKLQSIIGKLADSLDNDEDIKAATLNQRATAFGIAFDKNRLLNDQSTSNVAVAYTDDDKLLACQRYLERNGYTVIAPGSVVEG